MFSMKKPASLCASGSFLRLMNSLHSLLPIFMSFLVSACAAESCSTEKFLMPGTYQVQLQEGEYWIWAFRTWKTQKIYDGHYPSKLTIKSVGADAPKIEKFKDQITYSDSGHAGARIWRTQITKSGLYTISNTERNQRFVLVIAQQKDHYRGLGSDIVCRNLLTEVFQGN